MNNHELKLYYLIFFLNHISDSSTSESEIDEPSYQHETPSSKNDPFEASTSECDPIEKLQTFPNATAIVDLPGYQSLFKDVKCAISNKNLDYGGFEIANRSSNQIKFFKLSDNDRVDIERSVLLLNSSIVKIFVHGVELPTTSNHVIIGNNCTNVADFEIFLKKCFH